MATGDGRQSMTIDEYRAWVAKGGDVAVGAKRKRPKPKADYHAVWEQQAGAANLPAMLRELKFAAGRQWRFDYCWLDFRVALEIEGGFALGVRGRHSSPRGIETDAEKYNAAATLGWCVIRATGDMVLDGRALGTIIRALASAHDRCAALGALHPPRVNLAHTPIQDGPDTLGYRLALVTPPEGG